MSATAKALELYINTEENQEISKEIIRKLHSEQVLNGNNNKENTLEIVEILGGINCILERYLNEDNNISLTKHQLLGLNEILTTPLPYQQKTKQVKVNKIKQNDKMKEDISSSTQCVVHTFDINDNLLNANIKGVIEHKMVIILFVIAAIISEILYWIFVGHSLIYNVYLITLICLCCLWFILLHGMMNKEALILILQSFDFWIKVFYGTMFSVAVLFHGGHPVTEYGFTLENIRGLMFGIMLILAISYIAAYDATNTDKKKKVCISVFAALSLLFLSIEFTFFDKKENDYEIEIQLTGTILSMSGLIASSTRILFIFFSKQAFNTIRKNGRAISISYAPRIIWIDSKSNKNDDIMDEEKEDKRKENEIDILEKEEIDFENIMIKKHRSISYSSEQND